MDQTIVSSVGADVTVGDLPSWLTNEDPAPPAPSKQRKALIFVQFETTFQRVLELISSGSTFISAIRELPIELDAGAYLRWIKKDSERDRMYREAKEIRTEAWAGKLVDYAEGADTAEDVQRSKLKVDTLKWLMAADNRRTYGESKTIELGGSISITQALAAASQRVIEAEVIDITPRLPMEQEED